MRLDTIATRSTPFVIQGNKWLKTYYLHGNDRTDYVHIGYVLVTVYWHEPSIYSFLWAKVCGMITRWSTGEVFAAKMSEWKNETRWRLIAKEMAAAAHKRKTLSPPNLEVTTPAGEKRSAELKKKTIAIERRSSRYEITKKSILSVLN